MTAGYTDVLEILKQISDGFTLAIGESRFVEAVFGSPCGYVRYGPCGDDGSSGPLQQDDRALPISKERVGPRRVDVYRV